MMQDTNMTLMRHDAAMLAAELGTANLQQTYRDTKARLAVDKAAYNKAFKQIYFDTFEALKDKEPEPEKAFNAAYSERVAHAKADFDEAHLANAEKTDD
jgi:hypothetical protein